MAKLRVGSNKDKAREILPGDCWTDQVVTAVWELGCEALQPRLVPSRGH